MKITLEGKSVTVLTIDLEKGLFDFRWDDGVYHGVCVAPINSAGLEAGLKDFAVAVEANVDKVSINKLYKESVATIEAVKAEE